MGRRMIALCALGWGLAAHAEEVTFDLDWAEGQRWRAVVEWEVELTDPSGERSTRSGVVRALWTWNGTELVADEVLRVRSSPRQDGVAVSVGAAMAKGFRARLEPEPVSTPAPVPPAPAPVPEAAPEGAAPAEGSPPPEAPAPEAAPIQVVEAPVAPAVAPDAWVPAAGVPDFGALLLGQLAGSPLRALGGLAGTASQGGQTQAITVSAPGLESPSVATRRVDVLAFCPDTGPTVPCVEVSTQRAWGTTSIEASVVTEGGRRSTDVWSVEPSTLVPHAGRLETVVGYVDAASGKPGVWRARLSQKVSLLPMQAPPSP